MGSQHKDSPRDDWAIIAAADTVVLCLPGEARRINLAFIDVGALYCKKVPVCEPCPLRAHCNYYRTVKQVVQSLYRIRIRYEPCLSGMDQVDAAMPDVTEEEIVTVEASSLEEAAKWVMLHNTISPGGRLVSYYDELGNQVIPDHARRAPDMID